MIRGRSARTAAAAVDAQYQLKDRAVSAVDFIRRGKSTPMHQLQVADAEQHLESLDPRRVAPFRLPAAVPYAAARAGAGPRPLALAPADIRSGQATRAARVDPGRRR